jgi:transcriptional regulator with XRE-family HTH domain
MKSGGLVLDQIMTEMVADGRMASDICVLLGQRIRKLRKAKGWRQIDLAEQADVHEVHISDLERGARDVGLRTLLAIAQAPGVKLSDLFQGLD